MRFFEITDPTIPQPVATPAGEAPPTATKTPHPVDAQPTAAPAPAAQKPAGPVYADATQTKKMRATIADVLKAANLTGRLQTTEKNPAHPSIRILDAIPRQAHYDAIAQAGYKLAPADGQSKGVTGNPTYQANTYNFIVDNVTYTLVLAAKGGNQEGGGGAEIGTQQLRPNKLGLTGENVTWNRTTLAAHLNKTLPSVIKDQTTVNALNQLIDVALRKRKTIDPELMQHIGGGALNEISQSFGEVLTPILMAAGDNFIITFPTASNEMLIDAEVDGKPVAVKSLGGSGNSFAAIRDLIKQYSTAKEESGDLEKDEMFELISEFVSDKGSTNDNVIRVSQKASLPEAIALNRLLGSAPQTFADLQKATATLYQNIVNEVGEDKAYEHYIQMIMPVSKAGNWSKAPKEGAPKKEPKVQALGMPSDWRKYSGEPQKETDEEKPAKRTGKTAFSKNFPLFAAKQLTYLLGVAFDKEMNAGKRALDMGKTINKIMSAKNAVSARINITSEGGLELIEKPFSNVNWRFQYHAATDAPDRNAPGFAMKL